MRLVVAMTGATGAALGIRLLEALADLGVETHLILSDWARATIKLETEHTVDDVRALASHAYGSRDLAAGISSGSFRTDGMVVCPCSMKTLSAIRVGFSDNLITRAADVTLKERRRLVLVAREAPLSEIHLENMHYSGTRRCGDPSAHRCLLCAPHLGRRHDQLRRRPRGRSARDRTLLDQRAGKRSSTLTAATTAKRRQTPNRRTTAPRIDSSDQRSGARTPMTLGETNDHEHKPSGRHAVTEPRDEDTGPDLRSWLATLEGADQLARIKAAVDWNEEIGAITRANLSLDGPALLFENIIGHENTRCTKFLTSAIGSRRQVQLLLGSTRRTPAIRPSCATSRDAFRSPSRRASLRPARSRKTSSKATTSISGSFRRRSGMPPTAVATSTRSAVWSPRTR